MLLLNSLISKHSLYLLPLAILLKSCTNSSIVLSSCSILFNSATFIDSSFPPPNSFLISAKNSPIDSNSNSLASNSSNIFFFQISANPSWTCDNIHWICFSTMSQTSFSLYLHNQQTDFHKLSYTGKPQMRAIHTYVGCTKATTND